MNIHKYNVQRKILLRKKLVNLANRMAFTNVIHSNYFLLVNCSYTHSSFTNMFYPPIFFPYHWYNTKYTARTTVMFLWRNRLSSIIYCTRTSFSLLLKWYWLIGWVLKAARINVPSYYVPITHILYISYNDD